MAQAERVRKAVEALRRGETVVVVGNLHGVEVATLVRDAETVEAKDINYMALYGRGLVSCAVRADRLDRLDIPLICTNKVDATPFCVSVDAKEGTSTGISAHDRAVTARVLANPNARPQDLNRPGHLFPIRVEMEGVQGHPGLAEAAVDLAVLAGRAPVAVTCPILAEDGEVADHRFLEAFIREQGLAVVSVADLLEYLKEQVAEAI